jgi:hypothetical protein
LKATESLASAYFIKLPVRWAANPGLRICINDAERGNATRTCCSALAQHQMQVFTLYGKRFQKVLGERKLNTDQIELVKLVSETISLSLAIFGVIVV